MNEKFIKKCWCGCDSFTIMHCENIKKDIKIICKHCQATRTVTTPGVAVKHYSFDIPFVINETKS